MAEVEIPKGNWVARTLRLMNENSNELFPKTPADARPPSSTPCTSRLPTTFPTEVLLEGLPIQVGDHVDLEPPAKAETPRLREMQAVKLEEWQKRMPDVDRRLLEKVLRLQERDSTERQVALRFFSSLAGNRLMGGDKDEQTARLQQVVNTLQNPSSCRTPGMGLSPRGDGEDSPRRFKYVQQLDDETRQQRWMHTTWHHLPNYRLINPVVNMSSHYIKPHAHQHRHFVIHPDWG
nr:hypothetical protein BaRGS_016236 [Batillaria attramentaria]